MGLFGGGRCVEQAQGNAAVFFFLQAEVADELLFAACEFDGFGQGADVPCSYIVALEFLGVVTEGNGGGLAELLLQFVQFAAAGKLLSAVVNDAQIQIAVFGQFLRRPCVLVDLLENPHIACAFGDKVRQLGNDGRLAVWIAFEEFGDEIGYGHANAADLLRQCLNQQLDFFAQHTGHEPFERRRVQAVEDGQRHGHGHAVERMVRLEAVGKFELAVCGLPEFWELFFGNVRGGMLHQIVAAEEQQARIVTVLSQASKVRISARGKGFRRPF